MEVLFHVLTPTKRTIAGVPVIALFTLFELVIFNPKHPETRGNLALLDVAGGYFSRLEYASNVSLPSSLVSEFAYIAREYVNNYHRSDVTPGVGPSNSTNNNNHQQQHRHASVSAAGMTLSSTTPAPIGGQQSNNKEEPIESQQGPSLASQPFVHEMSGSNMVAQQQQEQQQSLLSSSAFASGDPMVTDDPSGMVPGMDSSPGSVSIDGINFPMGDAGVFGGGMGNDLLLGTDVMDLFNYSMPGIDPFSYADFRWT